jgi:hypothetical protein
MIKQQFDFWFIQYWHQKLSDAHGDAACEFVAGTIGQFVPEKRPAWMHTHDSERASEFFQALGAATM